MSGIFGIWNLSGRPVDVRVLDAMGATLAHRGPDGTGTWISAAVGLGHQAFWTTQEEVGVCQPLGLNRSTGRVGDPELVNADLVMVADARLDNRNQLIRALDLGGRAPASVADSELVLRAFAEWGEGAPARLLGPFAFAIWEPGEERLFLARDHMGVRPLYTHHSPGRLFAWGSEVKAILALDEVERDLDELQVARTLLVPLEADATATMYQSVRAHPRAHHRTLTTGSDRSIEYWALDPGPTLWLGSDAEYADAFRTAFETAVTRCVRTHLPVASMVSGGLDSSSIACVAAGILEGAGVQERLLTMSAVFDTSDRSDEREYSQAVVEHIGSDAEWFVADSVSPIARHRRLEAVFDGPSAVGNLFIVLELYERAAGRGAGVVLSGYDGDTTVSHGVGWLVELADQGRWPTLFREVKGFADSCGEPWVPAVWSWVREYGAVPLKRRLLGRGPRSRAGSEPGEARCLGEVPDRDWAVGLRPEFLDRLSSQPAAPRYRPRTERGLHFSRLVNPEFTQAVGFMEAIGAHAGVEFRAPFFDVELIELCLSLPSEQKMNRGRSRWAMRGAMAGILPPKVHARRTKANLEPALLNSLRTNGKEALVEAVEAVRHGAVDYFAPAAAAGLLDDFLTGTVDPKLTLRAWKMAALALWLRNDQRGARFLGRAQLSGQLSETRTGISDGQRVVGTPTTFGGTS